jgi:serine/threonine-protein kinase HipA
MASESINIWVYAHWKGMPTPKCIGVLSAQIGKGRKSFSFEYDPSWLHSEEQLILDPDIGWYSGRQYPDQKDNFGIFLDSMPDTWGRTLMKRRAILKARESNKTIPKIYDIDFLLGVYDESRMGALRFKIDPNGPFLDNDPEFTTPPLSSIRELQYGAHLIESSDDDKALNKWLAILMAPGSSLGGTRPKANILDDNKHPWIAKFPSKNDVVNQAAWEYLAYRLAVKAGIQMSESRIEKIAGSYHTFFTKRFDRFQGERVHFASAMTMTGKTEEIIRNETPSYLDLAEFIQFSILNNKEELHQLWRRIVFNIAVSNTDDHLRNHGFIIEDGLWKLSPAYDINPSVDKDGLALNIDMDSNDLDFDLAKSVGEYFQLNNSQMDAIIKEVKSSVGNWREVANKIGISRNEQNLMESAFKY